ncbi:unnamed protein product [Paramecium primaurelia]|uniref:Uncharacterized protein n=1 Tax=Paramecium primaurelia TaxID=5886 RepID=A0A8S1KWT7_PARPR|nr:unnamed protein product [Paramecium primaurelia]
MQVQGKLICQKLLLLIKQVTKRKNLMKPPIKMNFCWLYEILSLLQDILINYLFHIDNKKQLGFSRNIQLENLIFHQQHIKKQSKSTNKTLQTLMFAQR